MVEEQDLYARLGLRKDATPEEIRRAYYEAARRLHPDYNQKPGETELFLNVQEAYDVLSNPDRRTTYDTEQQKLEQQKIDPEKASPSAPALVSVSIQYSRASIPLIPEQQIIYVLMALAPPIKGASQAQPDRPPINLCLVLDRSTSMQGERMDTLKNAAVELVRQLRPSDNMAVVAFSDRAEILQPSSTITSGSDIETRISMIRTGGGTEISRGLESGLFELRRNLSRSRINHLILLTDGRTYGDEEASLKLASQAGAQGIGITTLGLGEEWNDVFLDELATRTGGTSMYISRPNALKQFFQDKLNGLSNIYAQNVSLQLDLGPEIELHSVFRLHPEAISLPADPFLRLGHLPHHSSLAALLEFILPPVSEAKSEILIARGELQIQIPSQPEAIQPLRIKFTRPVDLQAPLLELPPLAVFQAARQLRLYQMQEKARQDASRGEIEKASRCLQNLATHLLFQGSRSLAQTVLIEAENLENTHSISEKGEKQIKYGTRSLLLPPNA